MGSHAGDFFERFIKKAVIRIANLGADLRDGERGIGEKLAGPFNADMLQIFHDAGAGGLFEKAGEVAFAQKEASNLRIIVKVLLVEARTSLINGATIAVGTILGYSAMAGTIGGGGLGDIAIRYGYHRYQADIMIVTVVLLVILVQIFQMVGTTLANRLDKRR